MRATIYSTIVCLALLIGTSSAFAQSVTGDGSSREAPIAVGGVLEVGDYQVSVADVNLDAADIVASEYKYNEPPEDGNGFVLVSIEATYIGGDTGELWIDLDFKSVGDQNKGYSESDSDCGVIPNEAYDQPELFTDGTAEFNVCWQVPEAEASSLVMYVSELFSMDDEKVWFSLDLTTRLDGTPESN